MASQILVHKQQIAKFCRQYHIRRLSLFGSVLRMDFKPESDIDVVVEFDPEHVRFTRNRSDGARVIEAIWGGAK